MEINTVRRGTGLTLGQIALIIGVSRPQLSNVLLRRFGMSGTPAASLVKFLAHPPPVRQLSLI